MTSSLVILLPVIFILSTKIFFPSETLNTTLIPSPSIVSWTLCSTNCKLLSAINSSISSRSFLILNGE